MLSYPYLSYPILSLPIQLYPNIYLPIPSLAIIYYPYLPYGNLFNSFLTDSILNYPFLTYPILSISTLSYLYLPYPIYTYPILSLPIPVLYSVYFQTLFTYSLNLHQNCSWAGEGYPKSRGWFLPSLNNLPERPNCWSDKTVVNLEGGQPQPESTNILFQGARPKSAVVSWLWAWNL